MMSKWKDNAELRDESPGNICECVECGTPLKKSPEDKIYLIPHTVSVVGFGSDGLVCMAQVEKTHEKLVFISSCRGWMSPEQEIIIRRKQILYVTSGSPDILCE